MFSGAAHGLSREIDHEIKFIQKGWGFLFLDGIYSDNLIFLSKKFYERQLTVVLAFGVIYRVRNHSIMEGGRLCPARHNAI